MSAVLAFTNGPPSSVFVTASNVFCDFAQFKVVRQLKTRTNRVEFTLSHSFDWTLRNEGSVDHRYEDERANETGDVEGRIDILQACGVDLSQTIQAVFGGRAAVEVEIGNTFIMITTMNVLSTVRDGFVELLYWHVVNVVGHETVCSLQESHHCRSIETAEMSNS